MVPPPPMPDAIMAQCNEPHEQLRAILSAARTNCSTCCPQAGGEAWAGASSIAIVAGSAQADLSYLKSSSLQLWLFAYELPGARARDSSQYRPSSSYSLQSGFTITLHGPFICTRLDVELQCSALSNWLNTTAARSTLDHSATCAVADTILLFTKTELHIVTSGKKGVQHSTISQTG